MSTVMTPHSHWIVRNWRRIRNRHADGTKHEWRNLPREEERALLVGKDGQHWCSYDYCHCHAQHCKVCNVTQVVSDGTDEIR